MIGPVSHDPQQLKDELLRTSSPVVFDVETTGLNVRSDRVLSFGFRIRLGNRVTNHILFTRRCTARCIAPYRSTDKTLSESLEPLARPGLILIGHNIKFDLLMLRREGLQCRGEVRDTQGLLKLLDQDRLYSSDDGGKRQATGRRDLQAPEDRRWLNYRLKDSAAQICGIRPMYTPDANMGLVDYRTHTLYLAHDLYVTEALYHRLWRRMTRRQRLHYRGVASPLIHLLCDLFATGVAADTAFAGSELQRLSGVAEAISAQHQRDHGRSLNMSDDQLRQLLYGHYVLPYRKRKGTKASVGVPKLLELLKKTNNSIIQDSLQLIIGHREIESLRDRLSDYLKFVDPTDGRIHSSFDENRQVTGRISSVKPNLQQVAKTKLILPKTAFITEVRSRNLFVRTPGYMFVGADIDQADMRILADRIDSCTQGTATRVQQLYAQRWSRIGHALAPYEQVRRRSFNPHWKGQSPLPTRTFDPTAPSRLVADFHNHTGDLYAQIASNVTQRTVRKSDAERGVFKTVILAQVNGQTPTGLAKTLGCPKAQAEQYVARLFDAYPDVAGYLDLLRRELVITGQVTTWRGRTRTVSAHRWMVDETRVRMLLIYEDGNHYWFDVAPIRPTRRNLTCFVHRVWSVHDRQGPKSPRLIYDANRGRIGTRYYKQLDEPSLYYLPIRNLPWSRIRRVQKLDTKGEPAEEAKYEGFDTTARSAINTVMQGGTADLTVAMSLRCRPIASRARARLLLQIHDELIWEVPCDEKQAGFGSFVRRPCRVAGRTATCSHAGLQGPDQGWDEVGAAVWRDA